VSELVSEWKRKRRRQRQRDKKTGRETILHKMGDIKKSNSMKDSYFYCIFYGVHSTYSFGHVVNSQQGIQRARTGWSRTKHAVKVVGYRQREYLYGTREIFFHYEESSS